MNEGLKGEGRHGLIDGEGVKVEKSLKRLGGVAEKVKGGLWDGWMKLPLKDLRKARFQRKMAQCWKRRRINKKEKWSYTREG